VDITQIETTMIGEQTNSQMSEFDNNNNNNNNNTRVDAVVM
jgi:hypothetical protein